MRTAVLVAIVAVALVGLVNALPLGQTLIEQEVGSDLEPAETGSDYIRQKRTVGILRELFPNFSQYVDRAVQMITRTVFRVIGRLVLQGGGLGGGGGGGGGTGGGSGESRISITLPTYPPLPDEDEEDSTEDTTPTTTAEPSANDDDNAVGESQVSEARIKREAENEEEEEEEDLEEQATGDNNEVAEDEEDDEESELEPEGNEGEDPRNKRFLNFNLAGGAAAGTGSGGGSGNFVFDIIRLIAGSGTTAEEDEAANAAGGKADYGVGVPGPLTRLFVIANRGVANLIQDLILRMAQTSERLVNFKARLITSLI